MNVHYFKWPNGSADTLQIVLFKVNVRKTVLTFQCPEILFAEVYLEFNCNIFYFIILLKILKVLKKKYLSLNGKV